MNDPTLWRTPAAGCSACQTQQIHTQSDLTLHHPYSGHGYDRNRWSHPALDPEIVRALELEAQTLSICSGKVTHER